MQIDTDGEVGGGHRSAEDWDNTTQSEEKTSTFIVPSGEVSDDACRLLRLFSTLLLIALKIFRFRANSETAMNGLNPVGYDSAVQGSQAYSIV